MVEGGDEMKARRAGKEGVLTPEQRDLLKKEIDTRVRERMAERTRGNYVPTPPPKQGKS
jgi:hypothetical protein